MKLQNAAKETGRPRRPGRRSPPPPAILHGPDETLDGATILDEARSPLGVVLWQSLHDVVLWASVPVGTREGLFRPESVRKRLATLVALGAESSLETALTSLSSLVGDPVSARPEQVASVCLQVSRWAEAHKMPATSLAFAQGAALAAPADAAAGLAAGLLARKLGENARAETWLRRTVVLGRRSGDRLTLFQACLVLGEMYAERAERDPARGMFLRAFRGARRSGFREVKAQALHGLFLLASTAGRAEEAEGYARSALHAHGRRHPRLPVVAGDVGAFWMGRGKYAEAYSVLRLLLPFARRPAERIAALAVVARAAAAAGNAEAFDSAAREVWQLLRRAPDEEVPAKALLDLARGALELERWDDAERAASLALEAAPEDAGAVLDAARRGTQQRRAAG